MKKIAFHIQKGGTGKTTLSGNIAYAQSQTRKTVLIDCDPQGNASSWFIVDSAKYELADILQGRATVKESLIKLSETFYILPTFAINGGLKDYAETALFREPFIFDDLTEELEKQDFEIAIFDLSPGMSQLERTVIGSVDVVITPLTPEYFSLDGIEIFSNELKKLNKSLRKNVRHNKIVCNGLNKSFSRHTEIYKTFEDLEYTLFTIPQDSKIAESQLVHKSIFEYHPESRSIPELQRLSRAL